MTARVSRALVLTAVFASLARGDGGGDFAASTRMTVDDRGKLERGEWLVFASIREEGRYVWWWHVNKRMVFRGDKIILKFDDTPSEAMLIINSSSQPKEIGWGNLRGIYQLDKDVLKLAYVSAPAERPKDFSERRGKTIHLLVRVER
jgi:uncharacterized protein (TIGR03067 family)